MRRAAPVTIFLVLVLPSLLLAGIPGGSAGERGYLGFRLTSQGDRALVGDVTPEGPGDRAGLKPGDAVVAFNGVPFRFDSDLALLRGLEFIRPGVPVDLTLVRKERTMQVTVVPSRFQAQDLAALEDWLRRAELTERGQRKACALESFQALAAPPGIEVEFKKKADGKGWSMSTPRHQLPTDLDLADPFLTILLDALKPGDVATLRYQWSGGSLRSEAVKVPEYVNLEEISRQALTRLQAAGAAVRQRLDPQ